MTKRILILAPKGLFIAEMQANQHSYIQRAFGPDLRYELPGMKDVAGKIIVDAIAPEDFDEVEFATVLPLATIIGVYSRNPLRGRVTLVNEVEVTGPGLIVHTALDTAEVLVRQDALQVDDGLGNITEVPADMTNFHNWAGWEQLT